MRKLFLAANGHDYQVLFDKVDTLTINESYEASSATCTISCAYTSAHPGDVVAVQGGVAGTQNVDYGLMFTGIVDTVSYQDSRWNVLLKDMMLRAERRTHVAVPTALEYKPTVQGWPPHVIVADVLQSALLGDQKQGPTSDSLTGGIAYTAMSLQAVTPSFSFSKILATGDDQKPGFIIKYKSTYDAIRSIAELFGWNVWFDYTGTFYFAKRPPYVDTTAPVNDNPGATPSYLQFSKANNNVRRFRYDVSGRDMRNLVVTVGKDNAQQYSQSDPPVWNGQSLWPTGTFNSVGRSGAYTVTADNNIRQGAMLANEYLTSAADMQNTAATNLAILNKATEAINFTTPGDWRIHARQVATFGSDYISVASGNWLVYAVTTRMERKTGLFEMDITLSR